MSCKKITFILFLGIFFSYGKNVNAQSQTFNYTGTVQPWTVPTCVNSITIVAKGAQGGDVNGGLGAQIQGTFTVVNGNVLNIMVGQLGFNNSANFGGGGGGGSFVWNTSQSNALMVAAAGGGGGVSGCTGQAGGSGSSTTTPTPGVGAGSGAGGSGGNGGVYGTSAASYGTGGGGCGWSSNGQTNPGVFTEGAGGGGFAPLNGGAGGAAGVGTYVSGAGGYGGGGGEAGQCGAPGGGGGYNGGGGGNGFSGSVWGSGGGGGSFNGGTNQANSAGVNSGNGSVIIYYTSGASLTMNIINHDSCHGGSNGRTYVTVVGGNPPFTYAWAPGGQTRDTATGLTAGNYTVTVGAGCGTASAVVTITQPNVLTASTTIVNQVQCNGGSNGKITGNAIAGGAPYTYTWAPGGQTTATATALTAGTYTVTINDKCGSTATAQATITQPLAMSSVTAIAQTNVLCNGNSTGVASVGVINGGGTPYTYLWTPSNQTNSSATGLAAGNYTVTVKDACGASASAATTITQPATAVSVTASTSTNVSCNGQTQGVVTCTASGGTGAYTYSWNPSLQTNVSATNLSAGSYTVTVTDNNHCTATAVTTVTQPATLTVTAITTSNIRCNGGNTGATSSSVGGGTGPYSYVWTPVGGTNSTAIGLTASTYTVKVTDSHGCTASSVTTVTQPSPLSIVASVTAHEVCNGDKVGATLVAASAATGPYTYLWNPGLQTNAAATGLSSGIYTITVTDNCGATVSSAVTVTQPAVVKDSIYTITNVSCNTQLNGSVGSKATGGTGAYTYTWSPVVSSKDTTTGLSAGTYFLTVKDNRGCSVTASTIVTQPNVLTANAFSTANVLCNGESNGSSGSSVTGGTNPYTYSWTGGGGTASTANGLSAGTYTLSVVDKHGCTASSSVIITQPAVLAVVTNVSANVICFGGNNGQASCTVNGGTIPYTYSWTNGSTTNIATGLSVGTYTVDVWDVHGCTVSATATISQPIHLAVGAGTVLNNLCYNDNIGIVVAYVAGGPAPYAYTWTPAGGSRDSARGMSAGIYNVQVVDKDGCTGSATTTVTQPAQLAIQLNDVPDDGACSGAAWVNVTGGVSPYNYLWTDGNTSYKITSQCTGNYCCTVTDANGCMNNVCLDITSYLGVGNVTGGSAKIKVYPNPSNGAFTIAMSGAEGSAVVEVYNVLGAKVYSGVMNANTGGNSTTVNMANQPNGVYLYRVLSSENGSLLGEGKVVLEK